MRRKNNRKYDALRECKFSSNYLINAKGSVLVEQENTRVICAASVIPTKPRWMKDQNIEGGWLTGEYQMLPASTNERTTRDISRGKINGRSQEIQRLIGRSLRAVVDLKKIGNNTIFLDCDVIDADGGTRCASINGASVALSIALGKMIKEGLIDEMPMKSHIAAISVGIVDKVPLLDLCYEEDSRADVDMNVVMTAKEEFVEIQGTGESATFSQAQLDQLLELAKKGIQNILSFQNEVYRV